MNFNPNTSLNDSQDTYNEDLMLNYNIATKIFKLEPCECYPPYTRYQNAEMSKLYGGKWTSPIPDYINDATENNKLVEHMLKDFGATLEIKYGGKNKPVFFAEFIADWFENDSLCRSQKLKEAICLSALKLYDDYQEGVEM